MVEYLKSIFLYSEDNPLIFTRLYFWAFFGIIYGLYTLLYQKKKPRNAYLFLASLFFYYKTSGLFVFILIFSTLIDFYIGKGIYASPKKRVKKILVGLSVLVNLMVLSYFKYAQFYVELVNYLFETDFVAKNYFALWTNMFIDSHFEIDKILLPVGISFFTFQTISYSIDVYRQKIKPVTNILDFGFYVSFFPQLVAGPIVRAADFIPQLYKDYNISKKEFGIAIFWILNGLVKKMVISDYIAVNFIDRVFQNPMTYTGFESLMALYGYSLQVYADFSGYTDIAIGIAMLMGFYLPVNFNSPYKAVHTAEFWKRWHISLSTWLKDYLYIPIGGNRGGSVFSYVFVSIILVTTVLLPAWSIQNLLLLIIIFVLWVFSRKQSGKRWLTYLTLFAIAGFIGLLIVDKAWVGVFSFSLVLFFWILTMLVPRIKVAIDNNINLLITMLIGGLWHGASWKFVIWGGLNGMGLVIYKFWRKISPFKNKSTSNWIIRFYAIFLTFNFITFTRIWFRSDNMHIANSLMYKIANDWNFSLIPEMIVSYKNVFLLMLFGYVVHWLSSDFKEKYRKWFVDSPLYLKTIIAGIIIFIIYQARSADLQPFIYFQF